MSRREVGRYGLQADPGLRSDRGLARDQLPHHSKPEIRFGRPARSRRGRADRAGRGDHGARPQPYTGYWKAPEQTARVFTDGWYHTGDQGFLDGNGFIHISGRKKDMIVLANGQNVFPEDVEAMLQRHPAVEDAAVVGFPRAPASRCTPL